jgi:hypothetical protein
MAGIKISQLLEIQQVEQGDFFAMARGGIETYKTPATQFVVQGQNVGSAPGQFFIDQPLVTGKRTMRFRTLSAVGEGISVTTTNNAVVLNLSGANITVTRHIGDGIQREFSVSIPAPISTNPANYRVDIDGILQEPVVDYSVQNSNIYFNTQAPPLSSKIVIVSTGILRNYDLVPQDRSVTPDKVAFTAPEIQTTNTYTLLSADYLKTICTNTTLSNVIIIPSSITTPGFTTTFIQLNTGQTTISAANGVTINSLSGFKLLQQYATASIVYINSTFGWVLNGNTTL